ncbi:hypothetical protein [Phenylobacterium sp.]|uniref:hypothetical protein n=1 Tax=Phenylobacterium sp. TaxID=1871053 RepID=UPI00301CEEE0
MRAALLAAVALAASAAPPAGAQVGDTAVIPDDGRATVAVRTRPDQAGDLYRFQSDTEFVQTDDRGGQTQTNRQVFDLEVLDVEPGGGLRLRYTLREAKVEDSGGASMEAALKATVGESLEFRTSREGRLTALDNWPAFRERMQARVDAALPDQDPVRALVRERLGQPALTAADEMVLGDVRLMAALEIRGAAPLGITDLNAGRPGAGRATLEVSVPRPDCRVRVKRETGRSASGVSRAIVSEAEVAVVDGRVVTLTERRVTRAPGGAQTETIQIRRLSPAPAC